MKRAAGPATVGVHVDSSQFKRLFDKSSRVDKKLQTALRRNIRQAAEVAADASRLALDAPGGTVSQTPTHTGLRMGIAAGISVKVMTGARAGVTIVASSNQMPDGKASLVRAWEAGKGWRHPVFGNDTWTTQKGHPYFARPIFDRRDTVRRAVEAAMTEALKSLE